MHLNLSGIKRSSVAGRLLRMPLSLIPARTVVPILQGPLAGRRWIVGSGVHGYWFGSYEFEKQKLFADSAASARVVWDLGAHVGFYTLLASVCLGQRGRVFAFEPSPKNLAFINDHLHLNGCGNVEVCPFAVSDRKGTMAFEEGPGSSMGHLGDHGSLSVQVVALDDLVDAGTIDPPDLVKIDVEGEEVRALRGAERVLTTARPTIFLATHSPDLHRHCAEWLEARNYRLTPLGDDEIIAHAAH
jgi:FkbM family methyltransferase